MTNYWEELDKVIFQLRASFLNQYAIGSYVKAAHILFARNLAVPKEARIPEMPQFQPMQNTFRKKTNPEEQAFDYCNRWLPMIEGKMSMVRTENLSMYGRL